ncbi:MAG TPA: hypothetical protein VK463_01260 [Desulfomonilaceae bacterium]|nr:hypothetical protein [Desulfomonilaceae bacterium]
MLGKYRLLTLSAMIAVLIPCLPSPSGAFEIFPRPLGSVRRGVAGEVHNEQWLQRGDSTFSLSQISGSYYGDASWWPFLWNQNPGIQVKGSGPAQDRELPPGTRLNLYDAPSSYTVQNQSYVAPTGLPEEARFLVTKIPYQGIPYDKKYFKYKLSLRPTQVWGYIAAAPEDYKLSYLERDLVYISFRPSKRQAILVGDRFGIYRERGPINHPINPDRPIGFMSEIVGEVEITSVGHELATAIILESYVEIARGDRICLFTPRTREIVPTKTHRLLTGTILVSATRNDVFYVESNNLENDIVFIDRGECDGMREGMLLNIYRPSHPVADPFFNRRIATPDRFLGEGVILKAFDKNSTLLITRSREEVIPGDIIKSVSD